MDKTKTKYEKRLKMGVAELEHAKQEIMLEMEMKQVFFAVWWVASRTGTGVSFSVT